MRSNKFLLGLALGAVVTATSLEVLAGQPASAPVAPSAAGRVEAKRLYAEGRRLAADGKLGDAVERFRRAHDLAPTPVTRLELAKALVSQGRLVEAHGLLVSVAALPVTKTETQKSSLAREEAKELSPVVAAKIPKLAIDVSPEGEQEVTVDGKVVSKELLAELQVDPGEHTVVAKRGAQEARATITVAEAERRTVALAFVVEPPPPVPPPVGERRPPPPLDPPPEQKVGSLTSPPAQPPEQDGITLVVPIAFATAGIGLLTGLVTGSIALSQAAELKDQCTGGFCPRDSHALLSTHEALTTTSTVAFSLGGAAAAVGAIAWIVDATTSDDDKSSASLRLRWAGTGVALEGAW